ncbi:MAG: hypothetical protein EA370_10820 [Wenzhouxiangella sp.]|nr:MAG: hypothetical protein EA370_10820 [Wenzhouxiangella sp.]
MLFFSAVFLIHQSAQGQASGTCNWTGGGSGNSWHTAGNWSCSAHDGVPTASDDVVIQTPTATHVQVDIGADAECYSLTVGEANLDEHSLAHRLRTIVDDVSIHVGAGGVLVHQSGEFLLGQDLSSLPALRAHLHSEGTIVAYGRFWPRNANIHGAVEVNRPAEGGPGGNLQARGWNNFHGPLDVVDGALASIVWDRGHHGSAAPHIRVIDHDLVAHEGSLVIVFLNWAGGFGGIGHSQPGIQVENGTFHLHGTLRNSGFHQLTSQITAVINAVTEVSATGEIEVSLSRNQGIELHGPEGAEHLMAGRVDTGWLGDNETPEDAREGPGLRVTAGRSLVNTGEIEMHYMRTHSGDVSNINGGLIQHERQVTGNGLYLLGYPGPNEVRVNIEAAGDIEWLSMAWHAQAHAQVTLNPFLSQTQDWWQMATNGGGMATTQSSGAVLSLSLPRFAPDEASAACRWVAAGARWSCGIDPAGSSHVSTGPLESIDGEWAVGELVDQLFSDRFEGLESRTPANGRR